MASMEYGHARYTTSKLGTRCGAKKCTVGVDGNCVLCVKSLSGTFTTTLSEDGANGSFSAVRLTCDEPPPFAKEDEKGLLMAKIKIRIIGNWGNPD
jgi:hypothetical protein